MNNITIIEFGFRIISRIMEILEGVIGLDPYDFSDDTRPEFKNCLIYILRRSILTRDMIITVLFEDLSKESYFLISVLGPNSFIVFVGGVYSSIGGTEFTPLVKWNIINLKWNIFTCFSIRPPAIHHLSW